MDAENDALVGSVLLDRWRVRRRLGRRGLGTLYEAESTTDGAFRVVEVLLGGHPADDARLERYRRTVEAANELRDAHIVKVHAVGRTDEGSVFAVLDYLEGEDLATRLDREGALRWPDARAVLDDVASALSAAHERGIVHGRLEPASIFLMRRPGTIERALLLHFGVAELARVDLAAARDTGGHPRQSAYDSPEGISEGTTDARSDLYSLASILFELVTGVAPFAAPNPPAVLARVLTEDVPVLAQHAKQPFPTGLESVLARALAKKPSERLESVELFRRKILSLEALQSWTWPAGADTSLGVRRQPSPVSPPPPPAPAMPEPAAPARAPSAIATPLEPPQTLLRGPVVIGIALALAVIVVAAGFLLR